MAAYSVVTTLSASLGLTSQTNLREVLDALGYLARPGRQAVCPATFCRRKRYVGGAVVLYADFFFNCVKKADIKSMVFYMVFLQLALIR